MYSTDSSFETSHLPWPLYVNWTPTTRAQLPRPRSFSFNNGHSVSLTRNVCKRLFSLHILASSSTLRYSYNLGPFTTKASYFLFIVFCIFHLASVSRSHLYVFGHLTLVLQNSLLTSYLVTKIFLGSFVWSISIRYPNSDPFYNVDRQHNLSNSWLVMILQTFL
jgi:hypothetical protein